MKFPLVPTILVGAAVALMIGLGIWQLQRKAEKEALLASYAAAENQPPVSWQASLPPAEPKLYRRSSVNCIGVVGWQTVAGRSVDGEAGFAQIAECRTGGMEGPGAKVAVGWTERPEQPKWTGGIVDGVIAPFGKEIKLVSDSAVPGTKPLAPPSLEDVPNNHLSYAVQWFLFAAIAALIYVLALRRKQRDEA
ncbi:SURF1 family protein [Novosphingopyxis sp. YJ-S2-01]|uniref:SURF1 family protein n=1 Tax=Novosphingopyxis sp. YJ-S2-01 TaxID=2794021 RepID=UPI0018DD7094|nr:SURF1 family protein [Novosphingopyxis sp. YJ-S2-01]MBH9538661.1 SURF1 family protein [Novosphingopyxis sp. YJ-S2-01]